MYWHAGFVGGDLVRHPTGLTTEFLLLLMFVIVEGGLLLVGGGGRRRRQGQNLKRRQSRDPRVEASKPWIVENNRVHGTDCLFSTIRPRSQPLATVPLWLPLGDADKILDLEDRRKPMYSQEDRRLFYLQR